MAHQQLIRKLLLGTVLTVGLCGSASATQIIGGGALLVQNNLSEITSAGPTAMAAALAAIGGVGANQTINGTLGITGLLTTNGGIFSTQTGSGGTLGTLLNLNRTEPVAPSGNSPPVSLTENFNYADGSLLPALSGVVITDNVNGSGGAGPNSNVDPVVVQINENALRSTLSPATESQDTVYQSNIVKTAPSGGVPDGLRMRDVWNWWSTYTTANLPTSQGGDDTLSEHDFSGNGLDDASIRQLQQTNIGLSVPLSSGGYPLSINVGRYMVSSDPDVWFHDVYTLAGNFSHAGLDLRSLTSSNSVITSTATGGHKITVDNVMPLESGGSFNFGSDFPVASTAGFVRNTTAATTADVTITVNDSSYLTTNMFVMDDTVLSGITAGTQITSISGNVITLSGPVTVGSGDNLVFSDANKSVKINGDSYIVAAVVLDSPGVHSGTVYFYENLTTADSTTGVTIVPNSHIIWLPDGSTSAPWASIAFNPAGTATLRGDSNGGIAATGKSFGVPALTATIAADQSTLLADNRPNIFQTTLTPATTTTNVWENNNSFVTLHGPGTATGEINLSHSDFNVAVGANAHQAEGYETSLENFATVGSFFAGLANIHNESTGTATTIYGFKSQLQNDNTTGAVIGTFAGLDCEAMLGSGSAPTNDYCLRNADPNGMIVSLGKVSIGSLSAPTAVLQITGPDNSGSTNALKITGLAGTSLFSVTDAGGIFAGTNPVLSGSGIVSGDCLQFSGTAGLVVPVVCNTGGAGTPGGAAGSIQFNSAGAFGGFVVGGDGTLNTATGALTNLAVHGVTYGATPATNTVPVVTGSNATTYETVPVAAGGTGQTTYADGQLLIGNSSTGGLIKATITAGPNVQVVNGHGTIQISSTSGGGNVDGPAGATNKDCAAYNGTTGLVIQDAGGSCVVEGGTAPGNANYTILPTDITVFTTTLTVARIWTLPAASSVAKGHVLNIVDWGGVLTATNTITVTAAGSDTVNGGNTFALSTQWSSLGLQSDGISKWTVIYSNLINPFTPATHQFLTGMSASGSFSAAQPAFTDLSGTGSVALLNTPQTFSATQTFTTIGGYLANVTTQAGTAYTLASADCGTLIKTTNSAAVTLTLPNNLPGGCEVAIEQDGTGKVTLSPAAGSTLHSSHNFTGTFGQWAMIGVAVNGNAGGASAVYIFSGDGV